MAELAPDTIAAGRGCSQEVNPTEEMESRQSPAPPRGNTTLVEHMVGILGPLRAGFVMAAPGQPLPPLPVPVLRDELPGAGAAAGDRSRNLRAAAEAGVGSRLSVRSTPYRQWR